MKYTWKQKLEAVRKYAGSGTYDYPKECKSRARKRTYAKQVKFWYSVYLAKGEEGLMHKTANSSYPPEQKLGMIMPVLQGRNRSRSRRRMSASTREPYIPGSRNTDRADRKD